MRKLFWATLVASSFVFVPSSAQAWWGWGGGGPGCCTGGLGVDVGGHFNVYGAGAGFIAQAGPWYSYWPYEAYFQTPAPYPSYPYWVGSASPVAVPALVVPVVPGPAVTPGGSNLPPPYPGPSGGAQLPPPVPGPAR